MLFAIELHSRKVKHDGYLDMINVSSHPHKKYLNSVSLPLPYTVLAIHMAYRPIWAMLTTPEPVGVTIAKMHK